MLAASATGHGGLARKLTLLVWLLHTLGLFALADPASAWFAAEPFVDQDWALHHFHLHSLAAFWEHARSWGYSPSFMAGFPSNTMADLSIKFFELAALFTPFLALDAAFKLLVLAAHSAVPWLLHLAQEDLCAPADARGASAPPASRLAPLAPFLAAALGTAAWWNSFPREMLFYGMVGFPAGSAFGLWLLGRLRRLLAEPASARAVLAWLAGCLVMLPLHAQVALLLAAPGAALFALRPSRRGLAWIGAGVGLALLAHALWLVPLITHADDARYADAVRALPLFFSPDPWTFARDYAGSVSLWSFREPGLEAPLRLFLLALGAAGLVRCRARPAILLPLALVIAGCFALAYFGYLFPALHGWQCLRFKVPLDCSLALASSCLLATGAVRAPESRPRIVRHLARGLVAAGACAALAGFAVNLWRTERTGELRMHARLGGPAAQVIDWIAREAPPRGRILFEESGDESGFFWDGAYLSSLVAVRTGRELIGGPANLVIDRHHFVEFHSGLLFGRPIEGFADAELERAFELYDVTAIASFHPRSNERFARLAPLVQLAARFDQAVVWRVRRESTPVLAGRAEVRAGPDRIECSQVAPEELILAYHWVEGLASQPPLALERHFVPEDPIPFIRIASPPARFVLSIGGRAR
jgi:hypothetical protein